ncbi:hypothetical protein [Cellulomonas fimi]|uniref:Uncharacterized protein n=1 Tax=Cellulomonas fimi (strain ATCC 484 / DSM 20113 / JCM 1341 / CCUG 24087 / LMG 16345 / NBRC 15513 / NCIMB 8980 / NCTC 7547 / NRS-133) TaxID=590998 RepID=F4GZB0_CELFA|nr:hypothetical protein [Cellulomonas fimi]AEE47226.1 hypothetical protein Celf_3111 [Cellulomonas fimi ATCC 484]NNH08453.1 hypothetical protein [Cellulomonas fimi]VEH35646.1 Uncharacterised protein [Cellulomonas fimi]
MLDRYDGHILGLATQDGRRVVVGRWLRSPWPPFADVMTQDADGHRTLVAPTRAVADEIAATYVFDEVVLAPVRVACDATSRRWTVDAGPLTADVTVGARTPLGALLGLVPGPLTRSRVFATLADPVARAFLPGVRTRGSAGGGRREWYSATDQHRVTGARVTWDGHGCGPLEPVVPPVAFGFSSVPRRPTVTAVRTTIERPART